MLKLLYKTLVVSLLSGSLLMLDFSYKGAMIQMNSASAETLKTEGVGSSNMMATLTMTAVGLLASRLFSAKKTTDIMLAAAGGAAFVAGDILATYKNKEVMKDLETEITRNEKGKIDQKQIETLEKLKKSYEAAKETADTKKMLQMAAAAAFAAAGVTAYMMAATEQSMAAACMLGINGGLAAAAGVLAICQSHTAKAAKYSAEAAAAYARPYCAGCAEGAAKTTLSNLETAEAAACNKELKECTAKIGFDLTSLMSYQSTREVPSPSLSGLSKDTTQASAIIAKTPLSAVTCSNYAVSMATIEAAGQCPTMATLGNAQNSGSAPIKLSSNDVNLIIPPSPNWLIENKKSISYIYAEKIANLLFPTAQADIFSPMGIVSGLAIKYILATSTSLASTIDLNLLIPKRRAIVWGVLATLSYAASAATDSEIATIQSNIDKIDNILNNLYQLQNGVTTANSIAGSNSKIDVTIAKNSKLNLNSNEMSDIDLNAKGGGALPCITGDNSSKCPSFSEKLNAQADLKSLPDVTQQQVSNIAKMADGINGTSKITASTLAQTQALAGQANAIRAELVNKQKQVQDLLKANGSSTDLEKDSAKLSASISAAVQNELNKSKMTAGLMVASFGRGPGVTDGLPDGATTNAGTKQNILNAKKGASGIISGVGAISTPNLPSLKSDSDEEALLNQKKAADELAAANALKAGASASIDDYVLKNDITQDKESNIFDVISSRYQKSGYPRLFKKLKE